MYGHIFLELREDNLYLLTSFGSFPYCVYRKIKKLPIHSTIQYHIFVTENLVYDIRTNHTSLLVKNRSQKTKNK